MLAPLFLRQPDGYFVYILDITGFPEIKRLMRRDMQWLLDNYEIVTDRVTDYMPRVRKLICS
jgi:hypothetical protein